MGLSEIVTHYLPKSDVYLATITHGAIYKLNNSNGYSSLKHTGYGKTLIGTLTTNEFPVQQEKISNAISILNQALPITQWNENQNQALWMKLIINAIINPLTAIYRVRNGGIVNNIKIKQQAIKLTQELSPVIEMNLPDETWQSVWLKIERVAQKTAKNISSMYQDILNKRLTEIDYISGYIVTQAQQKGYQLTEHTALIKQVKRLENEDRKSVV